LLFLTSASEKAVFVGSSFEPSSTLLVRRIVVPCVFGGGGNRRNHRACAILSLFSCCSVLSKKSVVYTASLPEIQDSPTVCYSRLRRLRPFPIPRHRPPALFSSQRRHQRLEQFLDPLNPSDPSSAPRSEVLDLPSKSLLPPRFDSLRSSRKASTNEIDAVFIASLEGVGESDVE
jgi:hypothetical protein